MIGIKYACVLPEPVLERPITSLPRKADGITCSWIGVGCVKWFFSIKAIVVSFRLKSSNFFILSPIISITDFICGLKGLCYGNHKSHP